jgi:predicted house-cleaning noncanonical NTP pyrophosphatase (MazG superfamily)
VVCAKLESEMMEFSPEERKEYLADLVTKEHVDHVPTLDDLIALAFTTV